MKNLGIADAIAYKSVAKRLQNFEIYILHFKLLYHLLFWAARVDKIV